MTEDFRHHLSVLGLDVGASREDVKTAYRDLSKVWHPDRFAHDESLQIKAQEQLKRINAAFERLQSYEPGKVRLGDVSQRPPPARGMNDRILAPKARFQPSEYLWLVFVMIAILVVILLVLSTI